MSKTWKLYNYTLMTDINNTRLKSECCNYIQIVYNRIAGSTWGVVTKMAPSTFVCFLRFSSTAKCSSDVPGGVSTSNTSSSPHATSDTNWPIKAGGKRRWFPINIKQQQSDWNSSIKYTPVFLGPLHTTASSGSSSRKPIDIRASFCSASV